MTRFSVISSLLSPADIAAFIREKYALSGMVNCTLLKAGINHTYRVDNAHNAFIFRIYTYNWRTEDEITEELNLLEYLNQNHIPVSYPIADRTQKRIQILDAPEGERFGVLFSYAKGHKHQTYSKDTHFEIGRLMARIHQLTNGKTQKRITYTSDILLKQSLNQIRAFLSDNTTEMQFLLSVQPFLENELNHANLPLLRQGVVHLDIWFDNLNITSQNDITIFDFDFCGNGWLVLDLAYYILQLHATEKDETERREKAAAFYNGYETHTPISAEEKRLIPTLGVCLYYFYLGVQCSRFNNWSNAFLNEAYLKRYINGFIKVYYETIRQNKDLL